MAQTRELIKSLKTALKAQGKTYADVAVELGLTEASVKRLFSQQSFSLSRLDQVCHMLDMEITDLVQLMNEQQQRLQQLDSSAGKGNYCQCHTDAGCSVCSEPLDHG